MPWSRWIFDQVLIFSLWIPHLLEASFLNFGSQTCSCAQPCPPPPACPTSYGPCPASCTNVYQPYSTYTVPSPYTGYVPYPSSYISGYYSTVPGVITSEGYVPATSYSLPTVGAGGSYSLPVPASSYAVPSASASASSKTSSTSYAVPQMIESGGYVYAPSTPNQTPYGPSSGANSYTYIPTATSFYRNSGTATVQPSPQLPNFVDTDYHDDMNTDFKAGMPFVDVSYKSKELTPVDLFTRRNNVLKSLRERMRQFSAPVETIAYEAPSVCNNKKLGRVMLRAMLGDISLSKKLIRSATEHEFEGKKFDVFCATGDFSYSIYAEQYCEATRGNVTCFAFY